ncbi:MAG: hypothetical protein AAF992_00170 [Bacteroidota bacterium]
MARWFLPALGIRLLCGWSVGLLYLYYYPGGDTWNYFSDGSMLADLARFNWENYLLSWFDPQYLPDLLMYIQQPRALLMSKIISIGCLATQDNYWLISAYITTLSFAGVWYLGQSLVQLFPKTEQAVSIAWLGFPSFVFWSSGILKETIAVGIISFLVAEALRFYFSIGSKGWGTRFLGWIVAAYGLWIMKYYYAAVLIPLLISIAISGRTGFARTYLVGKVVAIFGTLILLATLLHPNLNLDRFLGVIVKNHDAFVSMSDPGNIIHFFNLQPALGSILLNAPVALFSAWFRPLLFETSSPLQHLAGVENLLLLILAVVALRKVGHLSRIRQEIKLWLIAGLIYATLLGVLLALSTPNFGTLIRYKVAYSPFLLYTILVAIKSSTKKE